MNIVLWVLQVLLALHTVMGAVWKVANSEQAVPSLKAMPHWFWLALGAIEVLCAVGLVLPAFRRPLGYLVPLAAGIIAAEMLLFCVLHLQSGDPSRGPMMYWLVVAALCAFIAVGRIAVRPIQ